MLDFWSALRHHLASDGRVFLAQVVANSRHSPGTAGARLLRTVDGHAVGTVGGGAMERDILGRGAEALRRGPQLPRLQTLQHRRPRPSQTAASEDRAVPSGMICAGEQTNLYAVLDEDDLAWVDRVLEHLRDDTPATLAATSSGFLVQPTDGPVDGPVHQLTRPEGSPSDSFQVREDLLARRRLAIFGGGHCALALARTMAPLGYRVEVLEAQTKAPEAALADHAVVHRVEDFHQAAARLPWPTLTWAVVMTSDFPSDVAALTGALHQPFPFLGVMGSPAKLAEIRRQLQARGFDDSTLARLTAPVGLALGSHTPAEIAISIAAQILQLRPTIEAAP